MVNISYCGGCNVILRQKHPCSYQYISTLVLLGYLTVSVSLYSALLRHEAVHVNYDIHHITMKYEP